MASDIFTNTKFKICRLCLCVGHGLLDIFEENGPVEFAVCEVIQDLVKFRAVKDPNIPWLICSTCLGKLSEFRLFKRRCIECKVAFEIRYFGKELSPDWKDGEITVNGDDDSLLTGRPATNGEDGGVSGSPAEENSRHRQASLCDVKFCLGDGDAGPEAVDESRPSFDNRVEPNKKDRRRSTARRRPKADRTTKRRRTRSCQGTASVSEAVPASAQVDKERLSDGRATVKEEVAEECMNLAGVLTVGNIGDLRSTLVTEDETEYQVSSEVTIKREVEEFDDSVTGDHPVASIEVSETSWSGLELAECPPSVRVKTEADPSELTVEGTFTKEENESEVEWHVAEATDVVSAPLEGLASVVSLRSTPGHQHSPLTDEPEVDGLQVVGEKSAQQTEKCVPSTLCLIGGIPTLIRTDLLRFVRPNPSAMDCQTPAARNVAPTVETVVTKIATVPVLGKGVVLTSGENVLATAGDPPTTVAGTAGEEDVVPIKLVKIRMPRSQKRRLTEALKGFPNAPSAIAVRRPRSLRDGEPLSGGEEVVSAALARPDCTPDGLRTQARGSEGMRPKRKVASELSSSEGRWDARHAQDPALSSGEPRSVRRNKRKLRRNPMNLKGSDVVDCRVDPIPVDIVGNVSDSVGVESVLPNGTESVLTHCASPLDLGEKLGQPVGGENSVMALTAREGGPCVENTVAKSESTEPCPPPSPSNQSTFAPTGNAQGVIVGDEQKRCVAQGLPPRKRKASSKQQRACRETLSIDVMRNIFNSIREKEYEALREHAIKWKGGRKRTGSEEENEEYLRRNAVHIAQRRLARLVLIEQWRLKQRLEESMKTILEDSNVGSPL